MLLSSLHKILGLRSKNPQQLFALGEYCGEDRRNRSSEQMLTGSVAIYSTTASRQRENRCSWRGTALTGILKVTASSLLTPHRHIKALGNQSSFKSLMKLIFKKGQRQMAVFSDYSRSLE